MKKSAAFISLTGIVLSGVLFLSGCDSTNSFLANKVESSEFYRIFDVKTSAGVDAVGKAAVEGLTYSCPDAKTARNIVSGEVPDVAPAFTLINPLKGSNWGRLASAAGNLALKVMDCEDAVWTGDARKEVSGDASIHVQVCVFQYKGGYHVNEYATLTKQSGGIFQISRLGAHLLVGSPEEWTEKALLDVVRNVRTRTGATIELLEGYPEIQGTPWLDLQSDVEVKGVSK